MTKKELRISIANLGIYKSEYIKASDASNYNPDDVYEESNYKYLLEKSELSHDEVIEALLVGQLKNLKAIKRMAMFFTIITLASLTVMIASML